MTTDITTAAERATLAPQSSGAMQEWELMQRRARAFSCSTIIPAAYQGPDKLANVVIALDIADRMRANPLQVMQNLHIINGRPSWSSSFLIATVNTCGRFTPMRFESRGGDDASKKDYAVRAMAKDRETGEICIGPWITWQMADAEGWSTKGGSKWKTMPELMFMYRAAAFWSRVYAPEVSMGFLTKEEAEDVGAAGSAHRGITESDRIAISDLQMRLESQSSSARPTDANNELADAVGAGDAEPTRTEEN